MWDVEHSNWVWALFWVPCQIACWAPCRPGEARFPKKFFTLRATPPAYPESALAPKCSKIAPTWHQNETKHLQNRAQMGPRGAKMEPKWRQDGVNTAKKSKNKKQRNKKEGGVPQGPHSV